MALGAKNSKGSQSAVEDLSSVGFLNVEIQFEQGIAALHTKREYKVRWLTLVLTLLGSIAGLVGTFCQAMGFVEERWIQYRLQKKKREISKKVRPKRYLKNIMMKSSLNTNKSYNTREKEEGWPAEITYSTPTFHLIEMTLKRMMKMMNLKLIFFPFYQSSRI